MYQVAVVTGALLGFELESSQSWGQRLHLVSAAERWSDVLWDKNCKSFSYHAHDIK